MASNNPTGAGFVLVAGRDSIGNIEAIEDFTAKITKEIKNLELNLTIAIDTDGFVDALFNHGSSRAVSSTRRKIFIIDSSDHVEAIYEHENIDEEINAVFTCLKARAPVRICEGPQVPLLLIPNALSQEMCSEVIATFNASESFPGLTKYWWMASGTTWWTPPTNVAVMRLSQTGLWLNSWEISSFTV